LLAEGKINHWKTSGYAEIDFEGAAPTANELESNSFNPRARQLWGQVQFNNGISIAGGQTWSLLTTYRKGIDLRQEMIPMTIDLQYVAGYNWARQWSVRVTKNFHKNMWAALAVENPETSLNVTNPPTGVFGFNTSTNATSPASALTLSNTPGANGVSTDLAPDLWPVFVDPGQFEQVLVSTPAIASIKEKQRLYESYRASAVDMEAATVARIAQAHNLPFQAIKAISDDASFELQELARFATQDGQFREAAFAAYSVAQPHLWSKLFRLAGNSQLAIQSLTAELESQLDWYRQRV